MDEARALRRARGITRELEALTAYIARIAAERASLIKALTERGWSEHKIAAELGISQPAVHKVLAKTE